MSLATISQMMLMVCLCCFVYWLWVEKLGEPSTEVVFVYLDEDVVLVVFGWFGYGDFVVLVW